MKAINRVDTIKTRGDKKLGRGFVKITISRNKEGQNGKVKSDIFGGKFILNPYI